MACFIVPGTEAIVVTAAAVLLRKHEQKMELKHKAADALQETTEKTGFSRKLFWLSHLLWGGVALLAFEHLWHGEVQPFFPFLTAAAEGSEAVADMLHEMATIWGAMVAVSAAIEKRNAKREKAGEQA